MEFGFGRFVVEQQSLRLSHLLRRQWRATGPEEDQFATNTRTRDVRRKKKSHNRIRQSDLCIAHAAASEERRKPARNDGWDAPSESSPNNPGPSASCRAKRPIQVPSAGGAIRRRRVMIGLHVHSPMSRLLDFRTCRGYRDDEKHAALRCFAVWHHGTVWGTTTGVECHEEDFRGHSERPSWHDVAVMGYRHSIGLRCAFVGAGACPRSRP